MKGYLDQFTPSERRAGAVIAVIVFVVLNFWFVWPHFNDLAKADYRMRKAQTTLSMFVTELGKKPTYESTIARLQTGANDVQTEEQAITFERWFRDRATESGVVIISNSRVVDKTNDVFFLEKEVGIQVSSDEKQLVNYLYALGAGNSLVRVRAMSLRPDPTHQKLNGSLTIVGSFQRKQKTKPGATAAPPPVVPASKEITAKPETKPAPKPTPEKTQPPGVKTAGPPNSPAMPHPGMPPAGNPGPKTSLLGTRTMAVTNKTAPSTIKHP